MATNSNFNLGNGNGAILITEHSIVHIFRRFFPIIAFYASELLGDRDHAEDVATEVISNLWKRKDDLSFANESLLVSYLYTHAKHEVARFFREEVKKKDLVKRLVFLEDSAVYPEEYSEALKLTEAISMIKKAVNQLPEQYRRVLEMLMDGKSLPEIAQIMEITESSVRGYKKKAIASLQKRFGNNPMIAVAMLFTGICENADMINLLFAPMKSVHC